MIRRSGIALLAAIIACSETSPGSAPPAPTPSAAQTPPSPEPSASPATVTSSCGDRAITGAGLGELKIGLSLESLKSRCTVVRDTTELRAEGMPAHVISVLFGRDTIEGEVVDGKIWRIAVSDRDFQTRDSLRVGTPLSGLLRFPGVHRAHGEDGVYLLSPEHCGLSFRLSGPGLRDLPADAKKERLEPLGATVSVSRILVTGCLTR